MLVTLHRAENVDNPARLKQLMEFLHNLTLNGENVIFPVHPRTLEKIKSYNDDNRHCAIVSGLLDKVVILPPLSYTEFLSYEKHAKCVITDSGTVMEECALFNTPCMVVRQSTERHELVEAGAVTMVTNISDTTVLVDIFYQVIKVNPEIILPIEYVNKVSDKVIRILTGN